MAAETTEGMSLEQILERLGKVVEGLERGDAPLEQSLTLYEEGVRLTREGQRRLDAAMRRIEVLVAHETGDSEPATTVIPSPAGSRPTTG